MKKSVMEVFTVYRYTCCCFFNFQHVLLSPQGSICSLFKNRKGNKMEFYLVLQCTSLWQSKLSMVISLEKNPDRSHPPLGSDRNYSALALSKVLLNTQVAEFTASVSCLLHLALSKVLLNTCLAKLTASVSCLLPLALSKALLNSCVAELTASINCLLQF